MKKLFLLLLITPGTFTAAMLVFAAGYEFLTTGNFLATSLSLLFLTLFGAAAYFLIKRG